MTFPGDEPEETSADLESTGERPGRIARARARAEKAKQAGAEILAREQAHRHSVRVAVEAFYRDRRFAGGLLAGGLAFRVFLWLLPFALVGVALLGGVASQLDESASDLARDAGLSAALAASVAKAVEASGQGRWYLLVVGLAFLLWAGIGVVKAIKLISGLAWEVAPSFGNNPLTSSVMVIVTAVTVLVIHRAAIVLLGGPFASDIFVIAMETALLAAIVTWVFWRLPHAPDARWLGMVPGAILVAVGVLATRVVTIVYFASRLERVDDLYGALGVASVFLAWLFILARLWVAGTSLNASGHVATRGSDSSESSS
jgi:uncharacterized BrkB/YihY/UPF0761 family membrane protein